jgi:hypothetical protein
LGARQYSHEFDMGIVASRLPFLVRREKSPFSLNSSVRLEPATG